MKAVLVRGFTNFEDIGVEDTADPQPSRGEVVVDVVAAESNYPDLLVVEGKYQVKPPLPFSPGKAAAGQVAALGEGVSGLAVGDAVALQVEYGGYAEKVRVRAESCFRMPDGMPFDKAAALGLTYQTAWFALKERARLQTGESVLVLGAAGGIGVASVQLAKALGANPVIAGVRGETQAMVARQAGADHVIDLDMPDLQENLRVQIASITAGHGADVVVDAVGGKPNAAALRAMAWCGRLVLIGFASGEIPTIKANYLLLKNITVAGLQWSDYRDRTPEKVADAQKEIFDLHSRGLINPLITRKLDLRDFKIALSMLRDGQVHGKIILQVRPM